jgi:aminopeptidase N
MISTVARSHPELAFDFAVAHREQMNQLIDSTSRSEYFPRLVSASLDPATIGKMRAFAQAYIAPTSRRGADTAVANIQYRIGVRKDRMPEIDAWLKKNG